MNTTTVKVREAKPIIGVDLAKKNFQVAKAGKRTGTLMRENNYKRYLLAVLMVMLASNFMDRLALGLLLQEIKVDLDLTDTQLGILTGIAFALFYSIMGLPIARWADRGDRVLIISLTTALWSATVALCGLAVNFVQLLLIRIGVAVGEAGCIPPAHSLIADYFTRVAGVDTHVSLPNLN